MFRWGAQSFLSRTDIGMEVMLAVDVMWLVICQALLLKAEDDTIQLEQLEASINVGSDSEELASLGKRRRPVSELSGTL